jgi:two-component sensor histidine kinase/tetratricopeptide (TPR) repeat protein
MNTKLASVVYGYLFIALSSPILAQTPPPENNPLDTLIAWVTTHAQTWKDPKVSHHYAHLAVQRALQSGTAEQIGDCYENLAAWHFGNAESENRDSIIHYDKMALEYYLKTSNRLKTAKAYLHVGTDLAEFSDYRSAQGYALQGIRILEQIKDQAALARAYADMSYICRHMESYEDAVRYAEQSIATYKAINRPDDIIVPLLYSITAYTSAGKPKVAIEKANEAIALIEKNGGQKADPGGTLRAFGMRGAAYEAREQYDQALEDYTYAWNFAKANVPEPQLADGYKGDIGNVLRLQGRYREAIPYFEDHIRHIQSRALEGMIWREYLRVGECYEKTGELTTALNRYQTGWRLRDSVQNSRVATLESELQIKYETAKKDETIIEQQARISQQQRIQWLTIGILALLGIVAAVIFFAYRNNQRITSQLAKKNAENELLLKEIHHRVKNNLQVISSLLSLQSAQIQDETVLDAMRESQNRVRSMALIHQKLYQGENLAAVEMRDYFTTLGESVLDSFGVEADQIQVKTPMEPLELDVDTAIPIGLIVNELVTNSMKYAFPNEKRGEIQISLNEEADRHLRLVVADTGVGMDANAVAASKGTGFGSQLVQLLTMQLNGRLETQRDRGMKTIVRFETSKAA